MYPLSPFVGTKEPHISFTTVREDHKPTFQSFVTQSGNSQDTSCDRARRPLEEETRFLVFLKWGKPDLLNRPTLHCIINASAFI